MTAQLEFIDRCSIYWFVLCIMTIHCSLIADIHILTAELYRIAGYFRNRNFRRSGQICISKVFIFEECIFRRFQINGNPCQNL